MESEMRKHLLLASAAIFVSAGIANAADVTVYEPAPAPVAVASAYNWSGLYLGLNAGYAGGPFKHPFAVYDSATGTNFLDGSLNVTSGGGLFGAQVGYNWQHNQMVFGAEADIQWSGVKGEVALTATDGVDRYDIAAGTKLDWFGTIRARVGYTPVDRFLVYATGGLAYGHTKSSVHLDVNGVNAGSLSSSGTKWGWTVGGGAEFGITETISFKTEYLYTDLGSRTLYDDQLFGRINGSLKSDVSFHTVRAGINFRF